MGFDLQKGVRLNVADALRSHRHPSAGITQIRFYGLATTCRLSALARAPRDAITLPVALFFPGVSQGGWRAGDAITQRRCSKSRGRAVAALGFEQHPPRGGPSLERDRAGGSPVALLLPWYGP